MFKTEKEMLESAEILKNFDFSITKKLAQKIGSRRIIFTGMGSSFLFPAKQAKNRALSLNINNRVEAFCSSDLLDKKLSNSYIFLCSNSGQTKETVLLLKHAQKSRAKCIVITAQPKSILAKKCNNVILMQSGFEKSVSATKSVIEQALILDSIIFNLASNQSKGINFMEIKKALLDTSRKFRHNLNIKVSEKIKDYLANSSVWYFVGRDTGVGEEVALKSHELVKKTAFFYPGTQILHGYEESMFANPVILLQPSEFRDFIDDFKKFSSRSKCMLFAIGENHVYRGIKIKSNKLFGNYCLLASGLGLLKNVASKLKIDIDHPKKILKVQNPYFGK